jgi:hypothetical protein
VCIDDEIFGDAQLIMAQAALVCIDDEIFGDAQLIIAQQWLEAIRTDISMTGSLFRLANG